MADVEVSYENTLIKSLSATGQAVLHTAGKYCDDDITIDYTKPGGGLQGDYLKIYAEEVTIGSNSVTNTQEAQTYLMSLVSNPGTFYALSPQDPLTKAYNTIGCVLYVTGQNVPRGRRYRSGSWGWVNWNQTTYDAKITEGDKYVVWTLEYTDP